MSEARRTDQDSARLMRLLDAGGRLHAGTLKIATTGVVAGWRVLSGPGTDFSVSPGSPEQVMSREALIVLLRAQWAPRARVLLAQDKRETVAAERRRYRARLITSGMQ